MKRENKVNILPGGSEAPSQAEKFNKMKSNESCDRLQAFPLLLIRVSEHRPIPGDH